MYAHSFRLEDGLNHVVLSRKTSVKRNGRSHTLCARRIEADSQRVTPQAVTTCDRCLSSFTGFVDVLDIDFEYATYDDRTGRWPKEQT